MVKVEYEGVQKRDERLDYLLAQVKEGVKLFVEAIRNSSEEHESVGFRAFTLKTERKEEADAIFDIMMTAVAVDLNEIANDLVKSFTFFHKIEENIEEKGYSLILLCDKKEPPTKEEIEKLIEAEKKLKAEKKEEETDTIPHASGIEYYKRPGSE
jgi:hypothetical protein